MTQADKHTRPHMTLRVDKDTAKKLGEDYPWALKGDLGETAELLSAAPGELVNVRGPRDEVIGTGFVNPKSHITLRMLSNNNVPINTAFFKYKLETALKKREGKITAPFYRLIHAESDGMPGLIVDRFGDMFVIQVSTAGMEKLQPLWLEALEALFAPKALVLRNDVPARALEGLNEYVKVIKGDVPHLVEVQEYGVTFLADLLKGQKTGWFYDQRDNRHMMARIAANKTVLDVYSHSGGFGIPAAKAGASEVTLVDASALALDLAKQAGARNKIAQRMRCLEGQAFDVLQKLASENRSFDIVISDPPAFVPSRKDIGPGLKGYEKVAKLSAALVATGGHLFIASCSHHASRPLFRKAVLDGIKKAGRASEILKQTGAAPDHPVHPLLPQSEYLKGILLKIT